MSSNPNPTDKRAQIEHNFKLHNVQPEHVDNMSKIRDKAKEFAHLIADLTPVSREQSLALTQLEDSVFWANAAIARNE